MSSERSEARRKLRECTGLVDSLMYIVQSQINRKDVDDKVCAHFSQISGSIKAHEISVAAFLHLHL